MFSSHKMPCAEMSQSAKLFKCLEAKHRPKFTGGLDNKRYKYCTGFFLSFCRTTCINNSMKCKDNPQVSVHIAVKTFPFHISLERRKTVHDERLSTEIISWEEV